MSEATTTKTKTKAKAKAKAKAPKGSAAERALVMIAKNMEEQKKPRLKAHEKRPENGFFHVIADGELLDFRWCTISRASPLGGRQTDGGTPTYVLNFLNRAMNETYGHHSVSGYGFVYPTEKVARVLSRFLDIYREHDADSLNNGVFYRTALETFIGGYMGKLREQLQEKLDKGLGLEMEDLPLLYEKGKEILFEEEDVLHGAIVEDCKVVTSPWYPPKVVVSYSMVNALSGKIEFGKGQFVIMGWRGLRSVESLPIRFMDEATKEKLTERGRLFREITADGKPKYLRYQGQLSRSSYWGTQYYRADGRLMIDPKTFARIDADGYKNEGYANPFRDRYRDPDEQEEGPSAGATVKDEDLWRTYPFLYGFSFSCKQWGKVRLDGLSQIGWREDAFERLVLDEDEKVLVRSLVEHAGGSFEDIVEGKGGGVIFLLHGPPGQGKTLTAETVAETLKRPLYAVSIGELGTNPDNLEKRLRQILDVATVWNAVLLLDEADIFLEERDEHDVLRNAMVGVFLRLLEYHQGVLFLTTNRVRNIDSAFYSRVSVALHFRDGGRSKRKQIWDNLLMAAGVKGLDTERLSDFDINGRQIKNVIRLGQTLAKAEGKPVSAEHLTKVIDLTTAFERERAAASPHPAE